MAVIVPLPQAIERLVGDGSSIAIEGFSHLVPFAAGHELLRQRPRDLSIIRMVPDLIVDRLIGAGLVKRLTFSWGGNPGVGSLHRFRDAVEHGWPRPIELDEHSHAGLANRFVAGASGMPFAVLRGYAGTSLEQISESIRPIVCPFTGERLAAVSAVNPDVAIVHAQRCDREGNVQMWGVKGVQKEAVLAARRSLVTVEAIVDVLDPVPGAIVLPAWSVTFVAEVPGGAKPSYAQGFGDRDDQAYVNWEAISRDRDQFGRWMDDNGFARAEGHLPGRSKGDVQ
jgi:glutaconate CoA-transferase, subunit A